MAAKRDITQTSLTRGGQTILSKFADLINPVDGKWDDELVVDAFCEEDAKLILTIPIHTGLEDVIAWHYDQKGIF